MANRFFQRIFRFCASLKLAVVVIALLILELAIATFYEARFSAEAAQLRVYGSPFFVLTLAALAVNVLAAAVIRFPWTRRQSGFVVTHLGIEILLAGCLASFLYGVDGQVALRPGETADQISLRRELVVVAIEKHEPFVVPLKPIQAAGYPSLLQFAMHPHEKFQWKGGGAVKLMPGVQLEVIQFKADEPREIELALTIDGQRREISLGRGLGSKSFPTSLGLIEVAYSFDVKPLGFSMKLVNAGPMEDPRSVLMVDEKREVTIRPNFPATIAGLTFYQSALDGGLSYFSVRRDPGWPVKYGGCALIVAGIVTMFCTRGQLSLAPASLVPSPGNPGEG